MRILVISAALAVTTAASAQDEGLGWTWEAPGVSTTTTDREKTAPNSVLNRLEDSEPETPTTNRERQQKWLEKFESRDRGGNGGGGGDSGGGGGHG